MSCEWQGYGDGVCRDRENTKILTLFNSHSKKHYCRWVERGQEGLRVRDKMGEEEEKGRVEGLGKELKGGW